MHTPEGLARLLRAIAGNFKCGEASIALYAWGFRR